MLQKEGKKIEIETNGFIYLILCYYGSTFYLPLHSFSTLKRERNQAQMCSYPSLSVMIDNQNKYMRCNIALEGF